MIARLQLFYGGNPMDWVRMPMCVLRSYFKMLGRLRAEKALETTSITMIGTGNMEKRSRERTLRDWERDASGPRRKSVPMTEAERIEMMKETGWFDVEEVTVG